MEKEKVLVFWGRRDGERGFFIESVGYGSDRVKNNFVFEEILGSRLFWLLIFGIIGSKRLKVIYFLREFYC